jgi:hypothetical protein
MEVEFVIFRKFPDGDIIALFPCIPAEGLNPWTCQSYMHVGQHGAADPRIVHDTRPARKHEYAALKTELERIGYHLIVRRRFPRNAYASRKAGLSISSVMPP